nr:hypothetical protein [Tanacetum cinerariifolium]
PEGQGYEVEKYVGRLPDIIQERVCTARPGEKKEYGGSLPLCTKCNYHHNRQCAPRCNNFKKAGHLARDCRSPAATTNNQRAPRAIQRVVTCFECEVQGNYKKDCPKLKNKNRGNQARNEQTDGEAMINFIQNGDQPLPVIAPVSPAGTAQNASFTLKDPKCWTAEEKNTRKIDRLARSLLIQRLPNDICSLIDSNETAKDLCDALERQMRGSEYGEQDRKAVILYECETFKATEREQLLDTYLRYLQVINDLKKCGYKKDNSLVAEKEKVSKCKEKVEVQSESKESDHEDISDLKKNTLLLEKAFNRKKYYAKLTNNNLRTSSASSSANKKPEYVKSVEKKEDKKVDEKKMDMSKVKCYNCKKEGHFAKDCKKAKTSRDMLTVGFTMRIPLLYRGGYSQWSERFMNYLEEQTDGEAMINSIKNGDRPLPRVTQVSIAETFSTEQPPLKDKSMWSGQEKKIQKIDRLARSILIQDRKAAVLYEYETFKATEGELLLDTYIRYLQYATMMRHNKSLMDINIDALYNILKQNQEDVNDAMGLKKKTVVVTSDH